MIERFVEMQLRIQLRQPKKSFRSTMQGDLGLAVPFSDAVEDRSAETVKAAVQFRCEIKHIQKRIADRKLETTCQRNGDNCTSRIKDTEEIQELEATLEWYQERLNQCLANGLDIGTVFSLSKKIPCYQDLPCINLWFRRP
mgnify:FL=1